MTAMTVKKINMEIIAQVGITRAQILVVDMMMMTFLQTQCAAHAKVGFHLNFFTKWGQSFYNSENYLSECVFLFEYLKTWIFHLKHPVSVNFQMVEEEGMGSCVIATVHS